MSKYIKLEDAIDAVCGSVIVTDKASAEEVANLLSGIKKRLSELPTIEVSEDCIYVDNGKKIERAISWLMQSGIQATFHDKDTKRAVNDLIHAFKSAPSVIPSRPRGEWIDHEDYHSCSVCGIDWTFIDESGGSNFCPNCGAYMKGDEK